MVGQQPINLPANVVIDCPNPTANSLPYFIPPALLPLPHPPLLAGQAGTVAPFDSQTSQVDVLFGPSGKVLRDAGSAGKVVFWIYDTSEKTGGDQRLVVIYTRTGVVASHPVNVGGGPGRYYDFVLDGRSSGM
jgi:hypothetical protein